MGGFVGALGDHGIRAGILLGESQRLHKTRQQNDTRMGIQHSNSLNQLTAVHTGHAVVGHDYIELRGLEEFQAIFAISRDLYATSDLFQ